MADVRRIGLDEVARHFEELEDPRSSVNRKHPLVSVVIIAVMAVLAGANGPTAIAKCALLDVRPSCNSSTAHDAPTTTAAIPMTRIQA